MQVQTLSISQLRNLADTKLKFSPKLNIFYGANGAGKTSVLEALYTLGNGRSFRTARHNKVINQDKDKLTLFSEFSNSRQQKLGLQRSRNNLVSIKLDQEPVKKLSQLATTFPVQILTPEQYELLSKGSGPRRKLMDWGVFHVEHSFLTLWQRAVKGLLQRNKLLKSCRSYQELSVWDKQLGPLSESITAKRQEYCDQLDPLFKQIVAEFLPEHDLSIKLYRGWGKGTLAELLEQQYPKDRKVGFTQSSIQKADLKIYQGKNLAADYLSRGQQKLVITALKLAQLKLMQQQADQYPVFLLDDIGAELDQAHQKKLLEFLVKQPENQQIFITCVHLDPLKSLIKGYNDCQLFHVEHGQITAQT